MRCSGRSDDLVGARLLAHLVGVVARRLSSAGNVVPSARHGRRNRPTLADDRVAATPDDRASDDQPARLRPGLWTVGMNGSAVRSAVYLEATTGFEPVNRGFADLRRTPVRG